jgi:transposase
MVDGKGPPLNFVVTGALVHASQAAEAVLGTPRPALMVTADKAYDNEKVRQAIRDDGAVPVIPSRSNATERPGAQSEFTYGGIMSKTSSAPSRIGGASPHDLINLHAIFWRLHKSPRRPSGSGCESRP